jgi:hypothetical protein
MSDTTCPRCGGPASRPILAVYCPRCDAPDPIERTAPDSPPIVTPATSCSVSSTGQHKFFMHGTGSVCAFCHEPKEAAGSPAS